VDGEAVLTTSKPACFFSRAADERAAGDGGGTTLDSPSDGAPVSNAPAPRRRLLAGSHVGARPGTTARAACSLGRRRRGREVTLADKVHAPQAPAERVGRRRSLGPSARRATHSRPW
jgi:hypothetical protein